MDFPSGVKEKMIFCRKNDTNVAVKKDVLTNKGFRLTSAVYGDNGGEGFS